LTTRTAFVEASTTDQRQTTFAHDVRGNVLLQTNPQAPHVFSKYDNLGREVASAAFSSTANIVVGTDDPTTETSNRVGLSQTFLDERGRTWKTQRHKIDVADGSDDDSLESLTWFDRLGRVAKVDNETELAKWSYDREGRQTHRFVLAADNDASYSDVLSKSDDQVLEESQQVFDSGGEVILAAKIQRFHSDKSTGSTSGPLDTNADGDNVLLTASNVKGRIQITASWYDSLGRLQDQVEYGTNGGSNFDRDGLSVPARSDTALRTTWVYNDDGTLKEVSDPKDLDTRYEYDALGRRTKVIANYVDGTPGGGTNGDEDQTVAYAFTDGLQVSMTADLPSGETDQVTTYSFGTVKGTSAGDSKIATGHLPYKETYPDSANSDDVVRHAYNAQGQEICKKDQAGNVQETSYDTGGRTTHRRITTLDADFDGAVRRISTSYNSRGLRELVTQYDNATVGSGSVVDEVKFGYDGWENLTSFRQDRNSAVGATGSVDDYEVAYTWEKKTTGRNTLRRASVTLSPGGRTYDFTYRSAGGRFDDDVSRVTQITTGGTALVTYDYNGVGTVVGTYLDEPDMMWQQYTSTAGDYSDLDRFNRVTTCKWTRDLATDRDLFKVEVGWDRNSNVTYQDDFVHAGFDVNYTNDNLNRLVRAEEGTRLAGSITSRTRDQQWTLSQTGNWELDKVDLNGDGDFVDTGELNDDRTHNAVNELNARDTDDNGTDNFALVYDEPGNLTDDGEDYEYGWDAFGRLRTINTRGAQQILIAEFKYNGLGFRISAHEDTNDSGGVTSADKWIQTAYDERWRGVGTYRESDTAPKEQYLNHTAGLDGRGGSSYIDLVVLRERDANTAWTDASDGTLEERLYYLQNWRADVIGLVGADAAQKEQVRYSAYGIPFGLPAGDCDSDGDCDSTDVAQVRAWIATATYDPRGDIDLSGEVNSHDETTMLAFHLGLTLARGKLSSDNTNNKRCRSSMHLIGPGNSFGSSRNRVLNLGIGRWLARDQLYYRDGASLYQYVQSLPTARLDPTGWLSYKSGIGVIGSPPVGFGFVPLEPGEKTSCEKLLDKWKAQPGNAGKPLPNGITGCKDGVPLYCTYSDAIASNFEGYSPGALEHIECCIDIHESEHASQADCVGVEGIGPPKNDLTTNPLEGAALAAEIDCFESHKQFLDDSELLEELDNAQTNACELWGDLGLGGNPPAGCDH
jgi:YD repeat-containing protein